MFNKIRYVIEEKYKEIKKIDLLISYLILFTGIFLLIRYQIRLLGLVQWPDEAETIVVTKMMATGAKLYTQVYNNHGPLVFLPGYIISSLGNFGISTYRIPIMGLQLLVLLSIYSSPIFVNKNYRNYFTVLAGTCMVLYLPHIFGHTYLYQVMSGLFFIIVLMQYTLPNYLNIKVNGYISILANFILYSIPFLAITNLPMVILLGISSFRKRDLKYISIGIILALSLNFGFLLMYGSLDGYIAYHFYLNSKVLYNGSGVMSFVVTLFRYYTDNFVHFMSFCLILICVATLNKSMKGQDYWRSFMLIPMMLSLVIRGGELYSLSGLIYLYVLIGLSSVLFIKEKRLLKIYEMFDELPLIIFNLLCLVVLYLPIEVDNFFFEFATYSEFSRIAQRITTKDERVLALTFRSNEYILADRLPASAHFIYLSIQAKYNQDPYKDVYVSVADDVLKNRPKIIALDKWNIIIDETDYWDVYAADLMEVVNNNYYQLRDLDIYIRNDINLLDYGLDPTYGYEIK